MYILNYKKTDSNYDDIFPENYFNALQTQSWVTKRFFLVLILVTLQLEDIDLLYYFKSYLNVI